MLDGVPDHGGRAPRPSWGWRWRTRADGKRDEAMAALRELTTRHAGQPDGVRAGQELARLERQARKKQ